MPCFKVSNNVGGPKLADWLAKLLAEIMKVVKTGDGGGDGEFSACIKVALANDRDILSR